MKAIIVNRIVGLWKRPPRDIREVSSVADRDKIVMFVPGKEFTEA